MHTQKPPFGEDSLEWAVGDAASRLASGLVHRIEHLAVVRDIQKKQRYTEGAAGEVKIMDGDYDRTFSYSVCARDEWRTVTIKHTKEYLTST